MLAAILASVPLISVFALIWLYIDTQDINRIREVTINILWLIVPSLTLFIALPILLDRGMGFYVSLSIGILVMIMSYVATLAIWKTLSYLITDSNQILFHMKNNFKKHIDLPVRGISKLSPSTNKKVFNMNKLYSVLIISSAIVFSNVSVADEKHYMSHSGDGPQGHMMEGEKHKAGMDDSHPIAPKNITKKVTSGNVHYMGHTGDGPQGHMMEGKKHPAGASTEHVEKYGDGKHEKPKGKHYMMDSGDGPQGHMMKGEKHPSN